MSLNRGNQGNPFDHVDNGAVGPLHVPREPKRQTCPARATLLLWKAAHFPEVYLHEKPSDKIHGKHLHCERRACLKTIGAE